MWQETKTTRKESDKRGLKKERGIGIMKRGPRKGMFMSERERTQINRDIL